MCGDPRVSFEEQACRSAPVKTEPRTLYHASSIIHQTPLIRCWLASLGDHFDHEHSDFTGVGVFQWRYQNPLNAVIRVHQCQWRWKEYLYIIYNVYIYIKGATIQCIVPNRTIQPYSRLHLCELIFRKMLVHFQKIDLI